MCPYILGKQTQTLYQFDLNWNQCLMTVINVWNLQKDACKRSQQFVIFMKAHQRVRQAANLKNAISRNFCCVLKLRFDCAHYQCDGQRRQSNSSFEFKTAPTDTLKFGGPFKNIKGDCGSWQKFITFIFILAFTCAKLFVVKL